MGLNSNKQGNGEDSESQPKGSSSSGSLKKFLVSPIAKSDSKAWQYSGLGIQLVGTILVLLFIGVWLDGKFGTKFIWTLVLTFIGFAGGFYSFVLSINRLNKEEEEAKKKQNK